MEGGLIGRITDLRVLIIITNLCPVNRDAVHGLKKTSRANGRNWPINKAPGATLIVCYREAGQGGSIGENE